jgi:hypothetical protein
MISGLLETNTAPDSGIRQKFTGCRILIYSPEYLNCSIAPIQYLTIGSTEMYVIVGTFQDESRRDPIVRGPFDTDEQAFLTSMDLAIIAGPKGIKIIFTIAELKEPKL